MVRRVSIILMLSIVSAAALDWRELPPGRVADLTVANSNKPGFTLLPPVSTGITFTNTLPESRFRTNQVLLNGSGVAAGDIDGDGWCDLYFCRLEGPNALYKNLGGWKFQDVTKASGVDCPNMDASGAALADLDGDGDLDLIVNSVGQGTHIFLNDSKGHFSPARYSPLNAKRGGTSLAEKNSQKRRIDRNTIFGVLDEAEPLEFIHEGVYS